MFKRAEKKNSKLRMAICGPAGHGKTYTSLVVGSVLGKKMAVIDTERASASKYADKFSFDVCELPDSDPRTYVKAIKDAQNNGYDVLVIDSLSHAWAGERGALNLVDDEAKKTRSKNSYTAWRNITPLHNALVEAILQYDGHVITTLRSKTAYELQEDGKGGKKPVKIGLAPVQRDGIEYEFDLVGEMDEEHNFIVSKTRFPEFSRALIKEPGVRFAKKILDELTGSPSQVVSDGSLDDERLTLWKEYQVLMSQYGEYVKPEVRQKPKSMTELKAFISELKEVANGANG